MMKILRIGMYVILGIVLVLYLFFRFGMKMEKTEKESIEFFSKRNIISNFGYYQYGEKQMHYVETGNPNKPAIVFIHGSPGSWDAYIEYLADSALLKKYRLISIDRMGFGKSHPDPVSSLDDQANSVYALIEQLPDSLPVIIVGHSYGGPVCYRLAMMYPERINGMLIIAGLASATHERRLAIQKPLRSKYLRWLMPSPLDKSNREIVPHKGELKKIEADWQKIETMTTIIQGEKDILVSAEHARYAERQLAHIQPHMVYMPKDNHFILWTRKEKMTEELIRLADRASMEFFLKKQ